MYIVIKAGFYRVEKRSALEALQVIHFLTVAVYIASWMGRRLQRLTQGSSRQSRFTRREVFHSVLFANRSEGK